VPAPTDSDRNATRLVEVGAAWQGKTPGHYTVVIDREPVAWNRSPRERTLQIVPVDGGRR
jgi:hypothetical protein